MEAAATVLTKDMLLPENITDVTAMMKDTDATVRDDDGMTTMMNNYTTAGEHQLSTAFLTIYFCIRFLFSGFSIFGNTLTIIAVARFEKLQINTNFLICSLAAADMLVGGATPFKFASYIFPDQPAYVPLCLIGTFFSIASAGLNLFNILIIAIDRYIFICYPLHYPMWITRTKIYICISIIWVFIVTEMITILLLSHNLVIGIPCKHSIFLSKLANSVILTPQVLTLACLTLACYLAIAWIANRQGKAIAAQNMAYDGLEATRNRQQKKIAKMMFTVMGTYYVCWVPQLLAVIMLSSSRSILTAYVEHVTFLIFLAQCWLNPLIYAWKSEDFRVAFRKLLGLKSGNDVNPHNTS